MTAKHDTPMLLVQAPRIDVGAYFFSNRGDKPEVPQAYLWYVEDASGAVNDELRKKTPQH